MYKRPEEVDVFTPIHRLSPVGIGLGGAAIRAEVVGLEGEILRTQILFTPTHYLIEATAAEADAE
jgi:hypothetical protein